MKGKIILVNGPSSSGKSTLAKALLQFKQYQFVHLSLDAQFDATFKSLSASYPRLADSTRSTGGIDGRPFFGPITDLFHRVVAAHSEAGINAVVDTVLLHQAAIIDCLGLFDASVVTTVGLYCPLEELERRETARVDRTPGTARSQADIHKGWLYDCKIDSHQSWVADLAPRIIDQLEKCTAFAKMRQIYLKDQAPEA